MSRILDTDKWLPMMRQKEIEIISAILAEKNPKRILEWGSGNSTVFFSRLTPRAEKWLAIEDKPVYLELLSGRLPENAQILLKTNSSEYINYPKREEKFDFILIDGQHRDACLEVAFQVANEDAVILLHDCDRKESAGMMRKYKNSVEILIHGELPQPNGFIAHRGIAKFKL